MSPNIKRLNSSQKEESKDKPPPYQMRKTLLSNLPPEYREMKLS
jgi:hypothetical protein